MTLATAVLLAGQLLPRPPEMRPAGDEEEEDAAAVLNIQESAADSTPASSSSIFFECIVPVRGDDGTVSQGHPLFCNHTCERRSQKRK